MGGLIVYFKDSHHEQLYREYLALSHAAGDREYTSLCYLLAATGKPLSKYIQAQDINIRGIQAASRSWGSGEKALVKLGINIFTDGSGKALVNEIFRQLDLDNTRAALEGLTVRYGRKGVFDN